MQKNKERKIFFVDNEAINKGDAKLLQRVTLESIRVLNVTKPVRKVHRETITTLYPLETQTLQAFSSLFLFINTL